jgi:hypothetical protein
MVLDDGFAAGEGFEADVDDGAKVCVCLARYFRWLTATGTPCV